MMVENWIQLGLFALLLIGLTKGVGLYLCRVLDPKGKTWLDRLLKPIESGIYRACGIDPKEEHTWQQYLAAVLGLSLVSVIGTALVLSLQGILPLNPQKFTAPSWDLNFNTSISFMTNTNWQSYGGEFTLSYFSQMVALTVQNFLSPAVGLACAAALTRGIARKSGVTLGNFWVDLIRIVLYLLLPFAVIGAVFFLSQGVPQNFHAYVQTTSLEGNPQLIAQGPIASQEAIKLLGSNGGGFMNANSAHPYENPTPLSNFFQILFILLLPMAQFYYFGTTVGEKKHGWFILGALGFVFLSGLALCTYYEAIGNPIFSHLHLTGGNFEGKELRFGIFGSTLFACATTAVTCGGVNCSHDSLTPLGGLIPMIYIQLNGVVFGGVGTGLYSAILLVVLSVFISGLMIGRTPEYLGNKISVFDVKMTMLAVLSYIVLVHFFTSCSAISEWGLKGLGNKGPHGFSEMLYAYSSCAANNGSAFAGLSSNTPVYNITLGLAMLFGRFLVIAPVIALAGSLVHKKAHEKTAGSFPVSTVLFSFLLVGIILLICALTFFPALTLGPIVEQFFLLKGKLFA